MEKVTAIKKDTRPESFQQAFERLCLEHGMISGLCIARWRLNDEEARELCGGFGAENMHVEMVARASAHFAMSLGPVFTEAFSRAADEFADRQRRPN